MNPILVRMLRFAILFIGAIRVLHPDPAGASYMEGGGGLGAFGAYSYFLKGSVAASESTDFGLRFSESGSTNTVSREFQATVSKGISDTLRGGGDVFYRMEPDSVSILGIAPFFSYQLNAKTRLDPAVEVGVISQPQGSGGGSSAAKVKSLRIIELAPSLGLNRQLTDSWYLYGSAALYYYSSPVTTVTFKNRRRPLFTGAVSSLGTFPSSIFDLSSGYDLSSSLQPSLGFTFSKDASVGILTVSKWVAILWSMNSSWTLNGQGTWSNTGTEFYSASLGYSF